MLDLVQDIHNSLFLEYGSEDDRHIRKRSDTCLHGLYVLGHSVALLLEEVPFVYDEDTTLAVFLYEVEDVHVLSLHTAVRIDHHDADVTMLDSSDGTHDRIELEVFVYSVFLSDAGRVHEYELVSELVVI